MRFMKQTRTKQTTRKQTIMKKLLVTMLLVSTALIQGCSDKAMKKETQTSSYIPVGVQLWSVQDMLKQDFEGTIKSLSDMGFDAVEFAGVFGQFENDPKGLKAFLKQHDLIVSGAHVGFEKLTGDNIDATLAFYKALGANYLIIPWDERAWHPEGVIEMVKDLNTLYPKIKDAGFSFGFHNHDQEFNDYQSKTYWDYIALNTDKNLVLQLDVGWVNYAKKDAVHYVKEYSGRTLATHYKVRTHKGSGQSPILGNDGYDWANVFNVMSEFGGTKWVVLEQEEYPDGMTSLESVRQSKLGLDKLLATVNKR